MSAFQIILLSVFGAAAVAAVLIFAILTSTNTGESLGAVTVWGTFDEATVQAVLRNLGETDGRLKSVTYLQKNPESYEQELTNALASGQGPDLFILRNDYAYLNAAKIAVTPFELFPRQQFIDSFIDGAAPFLSQTGVVGVPVLADPLILYWNRDMLGNAGFSTPPRTWDELFVVARELTRKSDAGLIEKSTIAFGEFANVLHAKQIVSMLILQAGGPITVRDSSGNLSPTLIGRTGETVRPAENALAFYTDFANPSKDYYSWNRALPSSRTAFANGDLALYFGPASEELLIRRLNPNLNFAVAPVPQLKNVDRQANSGYVYALAVPKAAKNPQGGLTAAFLLASGEGSRALADALGYIPARRDTLNAMRECYDCQLLGGGCPAETRNACSARFGTLGGDTILYARQALLIRTWEDPNPIKTEEIFKDMIESVTSGAARASEAVQRAEQAMRQLVSL